MGSVPGTEPTLPHAAATTGLYALGGNDDAGTKIAAHCRLPRTDLGTNQRKGLDVCFISVRGSGQGSLTVATRAESWSYPFPIDPQGVSRAKPGRGTSASPTSNVIPLQRALAISTIAALWSTPCTSPGR